MGPNAHSYPSHASHRPARARRPLLALGLLAAAIALWGAAITAPAGAAVRVINGAPYGIQAADGAGFDAESAESPLGYEGGPVVHDNAVYAIYWDPGSSYRPVWQRLVNGFLHNFSSESGSLTNVSSDVSQYGDSAGKISGNSSFRGAYTDVAPYPTTGNCSDTGSPCITDAQIRAQLSSYISANNLPTGLNPGVGETPVYLILLPPSVTVCVKGAGEGTNCSDAAATERLCSYHSYIGEDPGAGLGTILYATLPWTAVTACQNGTAFEEPNQKTAPADVIVNEAETEELATVTDPLLTGWHDTSANTDEVTDKCRDDFAPLVLGSGEAPEHEFNNTIAGANYYLNDAFNQAGLYNGYAPETCINTSVLEPDFTEQTPVKANDAVTFNATESEATLGIARYEWNFGDGSTYEVNCAGRTPTERYSPVECDGAAGTANLNSVASVVHRYAYGGNYQVTLTLTDDGGHVASTSQDLVVEGAPAPPAGSVSGRTTAKSITTAAKPAFSAKILSRSLVNFLRSGLDVRYSVNERVAGYLQVLLATSLAKRLGIGGSPARGLPRGSAPAKIIATTVLVTTRAGGSTLRIALPKRTAAKLARLGKLPVMLRLTAHNAATVPVSATVLRSATLTR